MIICGYELLHVRLRIHITLSGILELPEFSCLRTRKVLSQTIEHSVLLAGNIFAFRIKYKIWMRLNLVNTMVKSILFSGDAFGHVPYSNWNRINRKVYFNSNPSDNANRNYAAPSLVAQGLLDTLIDFNQPPSMRPDSAIVESSCW